MFKSSDGAHSWTAVNSGLGSVEISALAVDPADTSTVYAATQYDGVFKSSDAGATWNPAGSGLRMSGTEALAIDPSDTEIIYAAVFTQIFRSSDGGGSWQTCSNDLGILRAIAVDPLRPSRVYAAGFYGLYYYDFPCISNHGEAGKRNENRGPPERVPCSGYRSPFL